MPSISRLLICLACILVGFGADEAQAGKRVALIIGNGDYIATGKLPNPPNDAKAIAALLRDANFDIVEMRTDLDLASMRRFLRNFSDQVQDAEMAVVFYAGHGIEVNGTNYLIPVDAVLERDIDVEDEAVPLERVMQILESAKHLRLVILDACRDNPFLRSMKRSTATRSIGRGLAKVDVLTSNTVIAFAARHGSTAADGRGANSPYTRALVNHLTTPGLDLRLALGRIRDEVLKYTGNKQEPFVYGSLGGAEVALVPAAMNPSAIAMPTVTATPEIPDFDFSQLKRADIQVSAVDDFMNIYVNGTLVEQAQFGEMPERNSILSLLKRGANAIIVDINNGKYGGCGGLLTLRINDAVAYRRRWAIPMKEAPYEGNCVREVLTLNLN